MADSRKGAESGEQLSSFEKRQEKVRLLLCFVLYVYVVLH